MSRYTGTGPGAITPDGCAVEFYAILPSMGEAAIVHAAVPGGASVLELGCGTGRILRELAALGHPVHGVDESPAMLARAADLPTTRGAIETVALGRRFDVVLLASTMINADPVLRGTFLATCRRHVEPGGTVVFQQSPPAWFDTVEASEVEHDGIRRVISSVRREPDRVGVVVEYHVGGQVWTHAFDRHRIGTGELDEDLARAGLAFDRWLTDDQAWFTARPVSTT